jgi:hypothetical protein
LSHGALSAHFSVWLAEFLSLNALVELNRKPPDGNTNRNPTMLLPAMLKWISGNAEPGLGARWQPRRVTSFLAAARCGRRSPRRTRPASAHS